MPFENGDIAALNQAAVDMYEDRHGLPRGSLKDAIFMPKETPGIFDEVQAHVFDLVLEHGKPPVALVAAGESVRRFVLRPTHVANFAAKGAAYAADVVAQRLDP